MKKRISPITGVEGVYRPHCQVPLKNGTEWGMRHRIQQGRSTKVCDSPAFFEVDGMPMCYGHAGRRALDIVLEEQDDG